MTAYATTLADVIVGTNFDPVAAESALTALFTKGSFSPTLQDSTLSNAEGQAYSVQAGNYYRLGDLCFFIGTITWTTLGTLTTGEGAKLAGFPFAATSAASSWLAVHQYSGLTLPSTVPIVGQAAGASQTYFNLRLADAVTGDSALLLSELSDAGSLGFHGCYETTA